MNSLSFKKHIFSVIMLCFLWGCKNDKVASNNDIPKKKEIIIITGNVQHLKDTTLNFSYYEYKLLKDLTHVPVAFDSVGNFHTLIKADADLKGWFSFGKERIVEEFNYTKIDGQDTIMKTETFDFKTVYLYLKPGDSVNVQVDANDIANSLKFSGTIDDDILFAIKEEQTFNNYKQKYLKNWYNVSQREPNDFKLTADILYKEKTQFLNDFKSSHKLSPSLVSYYQTNNYSSMISSKVNYPNIHSSYNKNKTLQLPDDYFNFLNEVDMKESIAENGIGYFYNVQSYLKKKYELAVNDERTSLDFYDWIKSELSEKVRYEYLAYSLGSDFSNRVYSEFQSNNAYPEISNIVKEKYKHLEGMLEGSKAPNVQFQNTKGDIIALSDFEGKYTYIDLWATWCGPCIKEIPSLQKIEKDYHGKNIQFVSISFDKEKDHNKWLDFVREKKLDGHQLIAKQEAHDVLSKIYNIKMIPRFIFLDPEGKIIDATAPFPSDPNLIKLFEKYNL